VGDDLDLAVLLVGDGDGVAEVAGQALDLDALLEESRERAWVEDLIVGWLCGVDGVLWTEISIHVLLFLGLMSFESDAYLFSNLAGLLDALDGALLQTLS